LANRSVYRSGFVEFENRYCSGFLNPGAGRFLAFFGAAPSSTKNYSARLLLWQRAEADMGRGNMVTPKVVVTLDLFPSSSPFINLANTFFDKGGQRNKRTPGEKMTWVFSAVCFIQ
jgi:hypothetical protein